MATSRPTRHRLFVAMGVATAFLAALLTLEVKLPISTIANSSLQSMQLKIDLINRQSVRNQLPSETKAEVELEPVPVTVTQRSGTIIPVVESVAEPARDWQANIAAAAKATVREFDRQEDVRSAMWRQSYSTMFKAEENMVALVETPIMGDLPFRQPLGVLGLGVTIGSCFIGVPIAGIPVEERSAAITVFYCKG